MATRFIAGQSAADAAVALEALWRDGFAATVDLLGEKTLTAADADHYAARVAAMLGGAHDGRRRAGPRTRASRPIRGGRSPRSTSRSRPPRWRRCCTPYTQQRGRRRGDEPARRRSSTTRPRGGRHHPPRHRARRDEGRHARPAAGDRRGRIPTARSWAASCRPTAPTPTTTSPADRLVRGDAAPTAAGPAGEGRLLGRRDDRARADGWAPPVFEDKAETDANYERCARLLHRARPASAARVRQPQPPLPRLRRRRRRERRAARRRLRVPVLYGMAEPCTARLRDLGYRTRVYVADRRAGAGHGLPRAPAAREHVQRELRAPCYSNGAGARRPRSPRRRERASSRRRPRPSRRPIPTSPGPFVNEPDAELRRAPVPATDAVRGRRAPTATGFAVPVRIGGVERAGGRHARVGRSGPHRPSRSAAATLADRRRRRARPSTSAHGAFAGWAAPARSASGPACCSGPRPSCAAGATTSSA